MNAFSVGMTIWCVERCVRRASAVTRGLAHCRSDSTSRVTVTWSTTHNYSSSCLRMMLSLPYVVYSQHSTSCVKASTPRNAIKMFASQITASHSGPRQYMNVPWACIGYLTFQRAAESEDQSSSCMHVALSGRWREVGSMGIDTCTELTQPYSTCSTTIDIHVS